MYSAASPRFVVLLVFGIGEDIEQPLDGPP